MLFDFQSIVEKSRNHEGSTLPWEGCIAENGEHTTGTVKIRQESGCGKVKFPPLFQPSNQFQICFWKDSPDLFAYDVNHIEFGSKHG